MKLQVVEIWMMISITNNALNTKTNIHPSPSDNIIQSIIICACTRFFASAPNQLTAAAVEGLSHGFLALSTVHFEVLNHRSSSISQAGWLLFYCTQPFTGEL